MLPRSRVRCPEKKKPRHLIQAAFRLTHSPPLTRLLPWQTRPSMSLAAPPAPFWRRPSDSFSPDHSPSRAVPSTSPLPRGDVDSRSPDRSPFPNGNAVYVAASQLAPFFYGMRRSTAPCSVGLRKNAHRENPVGTLFWRRPTLARPIAVLPSGLQRFTAVFGMGTGGATALLSPEIWLALAGQISGA